MNLETFKHLGNRSKSNGEFEHFTLLLAISQIASALILITMLAIFVITNST